MPDTPYIQITENTETRYRAIHHPTEIELYITYQDDKPDTPYYVSLKQNREWLPCYHRHLPTIDEAFRHMFESLREVLEDTDV